MKLSMYCIELNKMIDKDYILSRRSVLNPPESLIGKERYRSFSHRKTLDIPIKQYESLGKPEYILVLPDDVLIPIEVLR